MQKIGKIHSPLHGKEEERPREVRLDVWKGVYVLNKGKGKESRKLGNRKESLSLARQGRGKGKEGAAHVFRWSRAFVLCPKMHMRPSKLLKFRDI